MRTLDDIRRRWLVSLLLAAVVFAAFSPALRAGFIGFDDPEYVTENPAVQHGITMEMLRWALTTNHAANWHPLTWISHAMDCAVFGLHPAGHHATSLLLHAANSILLFLWLNRFTGAFWRSALAAAFFALHPLRVESVAWISERKDVLSALFFFATLWAYSLYTQIGPWRRLAYALALVLFALGLMAKPMLVTLPFILFLIDVWPLRRTISPAASILEKIPFVAMSAASCVVTFVAQRAGGTVASFVNAPLFARLENVPVAYLRYLSKTLWASSLAVVYPVEYWSIASAAGAILVLLAISAAVVIARRRQPWLAVGWFWFLGMLIPTIGLVQVGMISLADRYTYLPGVGLAVMIVWGAAEWTTARPAWRPMIGAAASVALAACVCLTLRQASFWRDTETLFAHTVAVTRSNPVAGNILGMALLQQGRVIEAVNTLERALAPGYAPGYYNLGRALEAQGQGGSAAAFYEQALAFHSRDKDAAAIHSRYGALLLRMGSFSNAIVHLQQAVRLDPGDVLAHYRLATGWFQARQVAEAADAFEATINLAPNSAEACNNLAWILATSPDPKLRNGARAVELAERAAQLSSNTNAFILGALAAAYAENGHFDQAIGAAQQADRLAESQRNDALSLALEHQINIYKSRQPFRDDSLQ